MVKAALGVCEREKGEYLIIDFYDLDILKKLIVEKVKEKFNLENNSGKIIKEIKEKMLNYVMGAPDLREKIDSLYNSSGKKIEESFGYIFTDNFAALTDSSKRNGHGLLGKILYLPYYYPNERFYPIFLRLDNTTIEKLKERQGKEISYIFRNSKINVVSRDQLEFDDKSLETELKSIEEVNLFQNRKTALIKEIRNQLRLGKIRIKK